MKAKPLAAEFLGTALLVFFGAGVATLSFGFKVAGTSTSAGVAVTALTFGLVLLGLVYGIGPISGCHVNPAVTMGFLASGRMAARDALGYWVAQVAGAIVAAAGLDALFHAASRYQASMGLGADGYGALSMIGANAAAALCAEVVLTFVFVLVILAVTSRENQAAVAGLVIGLTLALVHLIGIPIDGTSVNPARSIGPALFVGGTALAQLWVFIVGPLIGGVLAALAYRFFYSRPEG